MLSIKESAVRLALCLLVECSPLKVLCRRDVEGHDWHVIHDMNVVNIVPDLRCEEVLRFLTSINHSYIMSQACIWGPAKEVLRLMSLRDILSSVCSNR